MKSPHPAPLLRESDSRFKSSAVFIKLLSPFAPHISEEMWNFMGGHGMCANASWPKIKIKKIKTKFNIAIQINGKTRSILEIEDSFKENEIFEMAKKDKKISIYINNKVILTAQHLQMRLLD